jgi:uncharacterized protein YbcI
LPGTEITAGGTAGQLHADVSRSMVQLHKECYGKGPTKARTYSVGDLLICILEGGLLKGERTLRDAGCEAVVNEQRGQLQGVLRERFIDTVENLTGRKVVTFISGVDLRTEMSAEVFLLEPEGEDESRHEGLPTWAAQTQH